MVRVPKDLPAKGGEKVTPMEQLAPTANPVPQLFVWAKGAPVAMLVILTGLWPLLVSVTVWTALVVPAPWLSNSKVCGEKFIVMPVPASAMESGPSGALEVTVKLAERDPTWGGVKVMLMVQEPPPATGLPQLLVWANSPATPEMATLETVMGVCPVLRKTAVWTALVLPRGCATKESVCGTRRATNPIPERSIVA